MHSAEVREEEQTNGSFIQMRQLLSDCDSECVACNHANYRTGIQSLVLGYVPPYVVLFQNDVFFSFFA